MYTLSGREEEFYSLQLELKNKKTLQESLEQFVQGVFRWGSKVVSPMPRNACPLIILKRALDVKPRSSTIKASLLPMAKYARIKFLLNSTSEASRYKILNLN